MCVFYQRQAQPDGAEVKESADGDQQQDEGEKVSNCMRAQVIDSVSSCHVLR